MSVDRGTSSFLSQSHSSQQFPLRFLLELLVASKKALAWGGLAIVCNCRSLGGERAGATCQVGTAEDLALLLPAGSTCAMCQQISDCRVSRFLFYNDFLRFRRANSRMHGTVGGTAPGAWHRMGTGEPSLGNLPGMRYHRAPSRVRHNPQRESIVIRQVATSHFLIGNLYLYLYHIYININYIYIYSSSTAQGGGGSFKDRTLKERWVAMHGWQSESTDGAKGGCVFCSCSGRLTHNCWM